MVGKGVVLLRIQHLQQCACRAAVIRCRKLINLIQHHHRVRHTAFLDAVHNSPRHSTDIGAPVATDIRLIMHAAQAYSHILSAQGTGNALSNARFSRSRCPDKQQN